MRNRLPWICSLYAGIKPDVNNISPAEIGIIKVLLNENKKGIEMTAPQTKENILKNAAVICLNLP
jgi:hypothetical protein